MKIECTTTSPATLEADWLVVGAWEGVGGKNSNDALGKLLNPRIAKLRESGDFEGKANELLPIYESAGTGARRILFVGLGKVENCTPMTLSKATGAALRSIARKKFETVAFTLLGDGSKLTPAERTTAVMTGLLVAEGSQDIYRAKKNRKPPETVLLVVSKQDAAVARGRTIGEAVRWTMDLVNHPPIDIYPESFCERVRKEAESLDLSLEVFDAKKLAEEKMGCILGVGKGSDHEPRLLIMKYQGAPGDDRTLALVGKGVTFDSGGLSIKTAEGMMTMKCDMAGAASVVATTIAAARLKLPINILCLTPLAENMPSSRSVKPGDVLTAKNGMTIEVLNTDAEGRLVLSDALAHAVDLGATHIVDVATLTGACMVALGLGTAGVMSNDEAWSKQVLDAASSAGERVWPLPMFEEYDELIRSGIADMKNIGGRWGGAITGAKLLQNFVAEKPWVHIDIAGPAFAEKESPHQDAGGTGFIVRTLIELVSQWTSKKN